MKSGDHGRGRSWSRSSWRLRLEGALVWAGAGLLLGACGSKPPSTPVPPRPAAASAVVIAPARPASPPPPTQPAEPARRAPLSLRLMAFNDFHGSLESGRLSLTLPDPADPQRSLSVPAGGAAALAGLVGALRAQVPHSLLVASGDQVGTAPLISTLLRHESTLDVLNRLGLDIATLGNHEFDAGLPELQRLLGVGSGYRGGGRHCGFLVWHVVGHG